MRDSVASVYAARGFSPARTAPAYRTMVLDLSPDLDEIRASLSKRWRRQLKKGEKVAFEVVVGTDPALFAEFRELFETFVEWKEFEVEHGPRFHEAVHAALPEEARYLILLSRHEGVLAYGLVLAQTGDTAVYVLGATNPELRDFRPGHFLHWRGVEELKQRGLRWYDLGGIDPDANPGVYEFKAGMTEVDVSAPGPFEISPDPVRGSLVSLAEQGYRGLQRLKRKLASA
jgi:lipid II:glycine glycyltransferase (peptidoglycan interpeptide bridge formation enzyme)